MKNIQNAVKNIDIGLSDKWAFEGMPGLSVGIVHDDKMVFAKGYGYANLVADGEPYL